IKRSLYPRRRYENAFDRRAVVNVKFGSNRDRIKLRALLLIPRVILARVVAPVIGEYVDLPTKALLRKRIAHAVWRADVYTAVGRLAKRCLDQMRAFKIRGLIDEEHAGRITAADVIAG